MIASILLAVTGLVSVTCALHALQCSRAMRDTRAALRDTRDELSIVDRR